MNFHNQGDLYWECDIPSNIFLKLKKLVEYEENNKELNNENLTGNIQSQYIIKKFDPDFVKYIEEKSTEFFLSTKQNSYNHKLKLDSFWINKQRKYEFNPLHNHSGLVTFVCWIKIPYNLEDEMSLDNCKNSNYPTNSLFSFVFSNYYGDLCQKLIEVDKSYEGKCIFFNSSLYHQVYPFYTSDEYRISVSGNLNIVSKKNNLSYQ
jgi:hypothetical protein